VLPFIVSAMFPACGGDSPTQAKVPIPPAPNFARFQSDAGDFIGSGQSFEYTPATAAFDIIAMSASRFSISVSGDEGWQADFEGPFGSRLEAGVTYAGLMRFPFHDPSKGGLAVRGRGRGCNTLDGWFAVDSVTYVNGVRTTMDLRFEQHCEHFEPALRGTIHWRADDTTRAPGPVMPIPGELWKPAPGSVPSTGDYVYLESEADDFVGAGQTYTYAETTAGIEVAALVGYLSVTVAGWKGEFQAMRTLNRLEPGYYPNLKIYGPHNPQRGGLYWRSGERGCYTLTGWFAIDHIAYVGNTLTEIELRFEQRCEVATAALRGAIRWRR
jgi:hypothetical protein